MRTPRAAPPPLPPGCDLPADRTIQPGAPPSLVCKDATATPESRTPASDFAAQRGSRRRASRSGMRSASWLSSIVFHAAGILLLLLILVPADFGGTGVASLTVTIVEHDQQNDVAVLDSLQSTPAPSTAESTPQLPVSLETKSLLNKLGTSTAKKGSKGAGQSGSASGSFFGIEAGGHEFVYVLDMSGSMSGRRYERATDELIRSVEELGPHQKFYVLLFSSGTLQLFGQSSQLPTSIEATSENKERLAAWLKEAYQGGGTDPRKALRIALRMKPSAIFMLSDGQFNGQALQKKTKITGSNSSAFGVVAAAGCKVPIHSIAFEDRSSRANMQQLADMTGGDYRFVPLVDGIDPAEVVQEAKLAMQKGDVSLVKQSLHKAARSLTGARDEESRKVKSQVGDMYRMLAENALKEGSVRQTELALKELAQMDADARDTAHTQDRLAKMLLGQLNAGADAKQQEEIRFFLSKFLDDNPSSAAAMQFRSPVASIRLRDAKELNRQGKKLEAIQKLETVMTKLTNTRAAPECRKEHDRISKEILTKAQVVRQEQGNVASAKHLIQLADEFASTKVHQKLNEQLSAQAREMLIAARDANLIGNRVHANEIQQQIKEGFGSSLIPGRMQTALEVQERQAQAALKTAFRLEQSSRIVAAGKYRVIVKNSPGTVAARLAEERLRFIGQ